MVIDFVTVNDCHAKVNDFDQSLSHKVIDRPTLVPPVRSQRKVWLGTVDFAAENSLGPDKSANSADSAEFGPLKLSWSAERVADENDLLKL